MQFLSLFYPTNRYWEPLPSNPDVVKHKISQRIYGHVTQDSPNEIRQKMVKLFFAQIPISLFTKAIPSVYSLLTGSTYRKGKKAATKAWLEATLKWHQQTDASIPAPQFDSILRSCCLKETVFKVIQIAKLPLSLATMELASLYGMIHPYQGRALYAAIEHDWTYSSLRQKNFLSYLKAKNNWEKTSIKNPFKLFHYGIKYSEQLGCLAKCLQPKDVWDKQNFYQQLNYYHPHSLRSIILTLKNALVQEAVFFEIEGLGQDIADYSKKLDFYQKYIRLFSRNEKSELQKNENKQLIVNDKNQFIIAHNKTQSKINNFLANIHQNCGAILEIIHAKSWTIAELADEGKKLNENECLDIKEKIAKHKELIDEDFRQLDQLFKNKIDYKRKK